VSSEDDASDIVWLTEIQIRILHAEVISLFGGAPGVRDAGLLQRALARSRNLCAYEEDATLFDLAAAYAFGLAMNHAFIDGSKRVALLAARAFLFANGYRFDPDEVETVTTIESLAAGHLSEEILAAWIEANSSQR
jgi:death-on-curing protein